MKRILLISMIVIAAAGMMLAVAIYVPNTLPTDSDFGAVYNAGVAFVHRVPIYDIPAVTAVAAENAGVPLEKFSLAPFPYPPWYSLSTFYLGWLPIQAAATLWFEINLVMLFLSVWFLTDGWSGRLRLIAFPLGLFFFPVIGAMSIGQNVFPVLLGSAMLIYALRKENITLTTLGSILITDKPHIGALMALSVLIYLIARRDNFGRRVLRALLFAGIIISIASYLADPAWYIRYPRMLLGITSSNYADGRAPTLCIKCASLPVSLSRWFFDGALLTSAIIALILFIALSVLFFLVRSSLLKDPALFLNTALIITLLVSPYLFNYDFIFLLIPFAVLVSDKGSRAEKAIVIICYLVPTFALALYDRAGNITLLIAAIVMGCLIFLRARSQVDVPTLASYNTNN